MEQYFKLNALSTQDACAEWWQCGWSTSGVPVIADPLYISTWTLPLFMINNANLLSFRARDRGRRRQRERVRESREILCFTCWFHGSSVSYCADVDVWALKPQWNTGMSIWLFTNHFQIYSIFCLELADTLWWISRWGAAGAAQITQAVWLCLPVNIGAKTKSKPLLTHPV